MKNMWKNKNSILTAENFHSYAAAKGSTSTDITSEWDPTNNSWNSENNSFTTSVAGYSGAIIKRSKKKSSTNLVKKDYEDKGYICNKCTIL